MADTLISPSQYLIGWLSNNGFKLPAQNRIKIIKNLYTPNVTIERHDVTHLDKPRKIRKIIFYGRHEPRKGIVDFCDSLDILNDFLTEMSVIVTFVGGFSEINGQLSGVYLTERSRKWDFNFSFEVGFNRDAAQAFLRNQQDSLVVIPSRVENSPYTVVEAIICGQPILTSIEGGAKELIDTNCHADAVVKISPKLLSARIKQLVNRGARPTKLSQSINELEKSWLAFHQSIDNSPLNKETVTPQPKVVVGITHYERPQKLLGAIMSVLRQTYTNIELIVVDDGSFKDATVASLQDIELLLNRVGGRLIRKENGYLGAARNTIATNSQSDYLLFLDDDDLLFPTAVEQLVSSATSTGADITNCLNVYLEESNRTTYELSPETHPAKVSYVPLGGPISVSHLQNVYGAATALIKRSFLAALGGYTELYGVGYEDYELYTRALQAGADIRILPEPLYLYEVGRPSMVSATSRLTNKLRVIESLRFDIDQRAWRDAIEVAAGQQTINDQIGYSEWSTKSSEHKDILALIHETRGNITAHISALAEYARAIGAMPAARSWESKAGDPLQDSDVYRKMPVERLGNSKIFEISQSSNSRMTAETQLLIQIHLRRSEDATAALVKMIESSPELDGSLVNYCYILIDSIYSDAKLASQLTAAIFDKTASATSITSIRGVIVILMVILKDYEEAQAQFRTVINAEASAYANKYSDIKDVYGNSDHIGALKHFEIDGIPEGRTGFEVSTKAMQVISRQYRMPVRASAFADILEEAINASLPLETVLKTPSRKKQISRIT
ncbi:glycosyltransferase [Methylobacterium sp. 2A]|uniref:glycosyltransferase n=1 Tax=Methylobacterium sp. 2A TaxID=2603816 RepID=UPI0013521845|nr:glycosyltransferase [Methylobacterium sp. 2A]MWV24634.1 glycosyltransferase [Methylobacterium sp. 2A]